MKSRHLSDVESVADHVFKTKTKIILYEHTPSECHNSIVCYMRFSQEAKKRTGVDCRLGGVAIGLLACLRKRRQRSNAVFESVHGDSLTDPLTLFI